MSATKPMPDAAALARQMCERIQAAREDLAAAFEIADELYNAATGDRGPRDERVLRLEYAVGEDVRSFRDTFARDAHACELLDEIEGTARDIVDLVALPMTPREAVAS